MKKIAEILLAAHVGRLSVVAFDGKPGRPSGSGRYGDHSISRHSLRPRPVEVVVRDGYIYVTTPRPASVKVLSILGQLISQQNIPAGTSRLRISARGIYILKVGSITKRVTI